MRQERGISLELKPIGHNNSSPVPGALSPLHSNPVLGAYNNSLLAGALSPLHSSNPVLGALSPLHLNNQVYGAASPLRDSSRLLTPGVPNLPHPSSPRNGVPLPPARHLQARAWEGTNLPGDRMQH